MTGDNKDTVGAREDPGSCTGCNGVVPQDMFEILMNGVFAFVMTLIVKNNIPPPSATVLPASLGYNTRPGRGATLGAPGLGIDFSINHG